MVRDLAATEAVLARIQREPQRFLRDVRKLPLRRLPLVERAEIHRLRAVALIRLRDPVSARAEARISVRLAQIAGDRVQESRALLTRSWVASLQGEGLSAVAESGSAIALLANNVDGLDLIEHGLTLARCGDYRTAIRCWRRAAAMLEAAGRLTAAGGATLNVMWALLECRDGDGALRVAAELDALVARGAEVPDALRLANRACALALVGELVEALATFDRADAAARTAGLPLTVFAIDRLTALLRGGASLAVYQSAERLLAAARLRRVERVEVELLAAEAAGQRGDWSAALSYAGAARRRSQRGGGPGPATARAAVVTGELRLAAGDVSARAGPIADARRIALRAGDRSLVARADALAARGGRTPAHRIRRRGIDPLSWARVLVSRLATAAQTGDPRAIDRQLRALLGVRAELLRPGPLRQAPAGALAPFADAGAIAVRHALGLRDGGRIADLAVSIRLLLAPAVREPIDAFALGTWIDFAPSGRSVVRITTTDGAGTACAVGDWAEIVRLGAEVRSARRLDLLLPRQGEATTAAAAARLDALLFDAASFRDLAGTALLSVHGDLVALPWGALPTLRPHAWSIALPGVETGSSARPQTVTALVGPNVPNGFVEAMRASGAYPAPWRRVLKGATRAAVREALEHSAVVHLVAHGAKRGDDPLLSWIELHDGRLTTNDLGGPVGCRCAVLAACDAAAPAGDMSAGAVGPARALVAAGAAAVIAATDPVDHRETEALVVPLHRLLASDVEPAEALARARMTAVGCASESFIALTRW